MHILLVTSAYLLVPGADLQRRRLQDVRRTIFWEGGEVKNAILGFTIFKLGLNYFLTPFGLFYSILKCISMLTIGMVYVTSYARVKIILSEFINDEDATA